MNLLELLLPALIIVLISQPLFNLYLSFAAVYRGYAPFRYSLSPGRYPGATRMILLPTS